MSSLYRDRGGEGYSRGGGRGGRQERGGKGRERGGVEEGRGGDRGG